MLPVIALIGRPNVGKSTLFNRLTRSRDALVADYPGLTRDRKYGFGKLGPIPYLVIDTGGVAGGEEGIEEAMVDQTIVALQEADLAIIMVDGRSGLTAADEHVAALARKHAKKTWLAVNKAEGLDEAMANSEFHALGIGEPIAISAAHGDRIAALMEEVLAVFQSPEPDEDEDEDDVVEDEEDRELKIAVVGRPNVGKSTLINRLLGEDRLVVFDQPGTTRDSVAVPFERNDRKYVLIDTAGIRRKARVHETIENGRALVVVTNKWDGLSSDHRKKVRDDLERRLPFLDFAERITISALHGTAVGDLLPAVERAYNAAMRDMSTTELTNELEAALIAHPTPLVRGRRIKLRYAHQGGRNPPVIVIHGNQVERLPESYRRYLINRFRKAFKLKGTPVRLAFKKGKNPFEGRRNTLTPRQERKRKRLMKKVKK